MLLSATSPAAYSPLPLARSFHTSTMAMQRANPIMISPYMYSGCDDRNNAESANISTGPTTQLRTSDVVSTFLSANTLPNSSYFTLASGGNIINISPAANGKFVEPTSKCPQKSTIPGYTYPTPTPINIARNIHSVRNRSRKDNCFILEVIILHYTDTPAE